jgi:hypothetical protein
MSNFVLACPKTCKQITAEISTEPVFMKRAWDTTLRISCMYCHGTHEIAYRDAYVASVLDGTGMGPRPTDGGLYARTAEPASYSGRPAAVPPPSMGAARPAPLSSAGRRSKAVATFKSLHRKQRSK